MQIKCLDRKTAQRISSGFTIYELCIAVKELVENSIDAGSTSIEINIKNKGLNSIKVSDNGFGISEKDLQFICKRNCTSKISNFSEMETLSSYGFRGEALHTLCALGDVEISTCHDASADGYVIKYSQNGEREDTARKRFDHVGTTVRITNFLSRYHVRREAFKKNINIEYQKLFKLMQAYALIMSNIRFRLSECNIKSQSRELISIKRNGSLQDNIISVFNSKQYSDLVYFKTFLDVVEISGFISRPDFNCGRRIADRQFFYVNRRPLIVQKIQRCINSVYRSFVPKRHPFILINFEMESREIDVNISADKRYAFIINEICLMQNLKEFFHEKFRSILGTFTVNQFSPESVKSAKALKIKESITESKFSKNSHNSRTPVKNGRSQRNLNFDFFINADELVKMEEIDTFSNDEIDTDTKILKRSLSPEKSPELLKYSPGIQRFFSDCDKENVFNFTEICNLKKNYMSLKHCGEENINETSISEEPINKILSKNDFLRMEILGQFNLGFIITRIENDLFIVDQHAADEKYRFETLQKTTKIHSQNLFVPKKLELGMLEESTILRNLSVFEKNGFKFLIDNLNPTGKRLRLVAIPYSKNVIFGSSDVLELAKGLQENPLNVDLKLSRITAMFASRACRSAIMIGKSLSKQKMKHIINNLSILKQP